MMNGTIWQDYPVDEAALAADPAGWLAARARELGLDTLLAFADDGVIWGSVTGEKLALAGDAFAQVRVTLRAATLQEARLFGPAAELIVRREAAGFTACLIRDDDQDPEARLEERYWLWGRGEKTHDRFTLMREGAQGLLHAPPDADGRLLGQRAALLVRHTIDYDDQGQAFIRFSRLVQLEKVTEDHDGSQTR